MYGTIARFRIKPGMEQRLSDEMKRYESLSIPGYVGSFVFRMDTDQNVFYMPVVFDSKESYDKNADDPAQDARFREFMELLEGEPEWHDGEIIYSDMK